jgi:quercetin dioxygenase-like cupin family protein
MTGTATGSHHRWADLRKEVLNPLMGRRVITGERLMVAQVYLEQGAVVPLHEHENEQLTYVLEGLFRFWLGDDGSDVVDVAAGEVILIPPNLPHRAEALETVLELDVFCPPRQDWLDGTDSYLRRGATEDG